MTCGDSQDAFVDPTKGSIWSGSFSGADVMIVMLPTNSLALLCVGGVPFVGNWYWEAGDAATYAIRVVAQWNNLTWTVYANSSGSATFACTGDQVVTITSASALLTGVPQGLGSLQDDESVTLTREL